MNKAITYLTFRGNMSPEIIGILLKVFSGLLFSGMFGVVKYVTDTFPLGHIVFFRSIFAMIPLVIFLLMTSDFPSGLRTKYPLKHIYRCVAGTFAMFFAFSTLQFLPLAESTTLNYMSPVILVFFALFIFKEKVTLRRWLGVGLGLVGLIILTVPSFSISANVNTLIGISFGLISATLIAIAMLQVRQLAKVGENAGTIAFYFALTSSIIGGIATLIQGWHAPNLYQWFALIAIGLIGGIAQIFMTVAYKYAEASALAPYDYLSILWGVLIGFVFFGELPSFVFWIAMPLILAGAIVATPRQKPL